MGLKMKGFKYSESLIGCITFWFISIFLNFWNLKNGKFTFSFFANLNLISFFTKPNLSVLTFLIGADFFINFIFKKYSIFKSWKIGLDSVPQENNKNHK